MFCNNHAAQYGYRLLRPCLILLGTAGCHLCEQAEEIIRECLSSDYDEVVETIDIAEQEHWQARYAVRIPVLYDPSSEKELG